MPSGVVRLRYTMKYHPMPIAPYGTDDQGDLSGFRGTKYRDGTVLRGYKDAPAATLKERPFNSSKAKSDTFSKRFKSGSGAYKMVGAPAEAEHSVIGGPSMNRNVPNEDGRKSDKTGLRRRAMGRGK